MKIHRNKGYLKQGIFEPSKVWRFLKEPELCGEMRSFLNDGSNHRHFTLKNSIQKQILKKKKLQQKNSYKQ